MKARVRRENIMENGNTGNGNMKSRNMNNGNMENGNMDNKNGFRVNKNTENARETGEVAGEKDLRPVGDILRELLASLQQERTLLEEKKVSEVEKLGEAREPLFEDLKNGDYLGDTGEGEEWELVKQIRILIKENLALAQNVRDKLSEEVKVAEKREKAVKAYFPDPQDKPLFIRKNL